jgi:hypothetical protein
VLQPRAVHALLVFGRLLVSGNPKVDRRSLCHDSLPYLYKNHKLAMVDFDANRPINAMSVFEGFLYSRIAQAPEPRPADCRRPADAVAESVKHADHGPTVSPAPANAPRPSKREVEHSARGQHGVAGREEGSPHLDLYPAAAGVRRERPETQVRVCSPPRRDFAVLPHPGRQEMYALPHGRGALVARSPAVARPCVRVTCPSEPFPHRHRDDIGDA